MTIYQSISTIFTLFVKYKTTKPDSISALPNAFFVLIAFKQQHISIDFSNFKSIN